MICKGFFGNIFDELQLICLHTVKCSQILLSNTNNFFFFLKTQLNGLIFLSNTHNSIRI